MKYDHVVIRGKEEDNFKFFECLHKIYQIHYESNIKANISITYHNTTDNFDGGVLGYHSAKKKNVLHWNYITLCVFLYSRSFPKHYEEPWGKSEIAG